MNKILLTFLLLTLTGIVFGFGSLIEKQFDTITPPSGSLTLKNSVIIDSGTATTVTYLDGSKAITSSSVTPIQLEFLNTTTQDIQVSLDSKAIYPADLTTDINGILPVINGGTNSNNALNNNFVMISSAGSVVEDASISTTELGFLDGVSSSIQTQLGNKLETVDLTSDVGATILGISNGGTGSATKNFVDLTTVQTAAGDKTFSGSMELSNTGALLVNRGTTGERPGSPINGMFRYSSTDNTFEGYAAGAWGPIAGGGDGGSGGLDIWFSEDYEDILTSVWTTGNSATFLGGGSLDGAFSAILLDPIAGLRTFQYIMGATSLNDFLSSAVIVLDDKQKSNDSGMTFYYSYTGDDDDIEVVVWDVTNSRKLTSTLDLVKNKGSPTRYSTSFFPAANTVSIQYGFHVKVGNSAQVLQWDDTELTVDPFVYKNLVDSETVAYSGFISKNGSNYILHKTEVTNTSDKNFTVTTSDHTRYTFNRSVDFVSTASTNGVSTRISLRWFDVNDVEKMSSGEDSTGGEGAVALTGRSEIGDYLIVRDTNAPTDNTGVGFGLSTTATTEHVVTPAKSEISSIQLEGNDSRVITANTEDIQFTGSGTGWTSSGDTHFYTVQNNNSVIDLATGIATTSSTSFRVFIYRDTGAGFVEYRTIGSNDSGGDATAWANFISGKGEFNAGDKLSIRIGTTKTLSNVASRHYLNIIEASGLTFLAAVPVQKVAYIDVASTLYHNIITGTNVDKTRNLDHVSGDTSIVSILANRFTLSKGKYLLDIPIGAKLAASWVSLRIYNITTNSSEQYFSQVTRCLTSDNESHWITVTATLELTSAQVFEFRTIASNNSGEELIGRIKITKLR